MTIADLYFHTTPNECGHIGGVDKGQMTNYVDFHNIFPYCNLL
jgi:hypothetical protein